MTQSGMQPEYLTQPSQVELFAAKYLTHVKGKVGGKPLIFADWQRNLLREIFNSLDEDGNRRIRNYYVSVPRKAGKSTMAAAVALYFLCCDPEMGGEIYSAASVNSSER